MYLRPLESILFLQVRPRLKYLVPIDELYKLIKSYEKKTSKQETLLYVKKIIHETNNIFSQDMFEFLLINEELNSGLYVITTQGKKILKRKLEVSYTDGKEFKLLSTNLREEEVLREIKEEIISTEQVATEVMNISKELSKNLSLNIHITTY